MSGAARESGGRPRAPAWSAALLLFALAAGARAGDETLQQQRLARALREVDGCLVQIHRERRDLLGPLGYQGQRLAAPLDAAELARDLGQRLMLLDTALRRLAGAARPEPSTCRHELLGASLSLRCVHGEGRLPDSLRLTNTGALPLGWPASSVVASPSRERLDDWLRALLAHTSDDDERVRRLATFVDERLGAVASGPGHDELSLTLPALALLEVGRPLGCRDRSRLIGALAREAGLPVQVLDAAGHGVVSLTSDGVARRWPLALHDTPLSPAQLGDTVPIDEWARDWEPPTPLEPGQSVSLSRSAFGPRFRPEGPLLDGLEGHGTWRAGATVAAWRDGLSVCLPGPLVAGMVAGVLTDETPGETQDEGPDRRWRLQGRLADGPWRDLDWTHRSGGRDQAGLAGWLPNGSGTPVQRLGLRLVQTPDARWPLDGWVSVELHFAHDPGLLERVLAAPGWFAGGADASAELELERLPAGAQNWK